MTHAHVHPGFEPLTHTHDHPADLSSCHATRPHRHADGIHHSHPHADACDHAEALPRHRYVRHPLDADPAPSPRCSDDPTRP